MRLFPKPDFSGFIWYGSVLIVFLSIPMSVVLNYLWVKWVMVH